MLLATNGRYTQLPKTLIKIANRNVNNGDDVVDENSYCVMPQTPNSAKFFAIDRWM